jgi:hypothetical protein
MKKLKHFNGTQNISDASSCYSMEFVELQKQLKDAEWRYIHGKNTMEQNNANYDMMIILGKIKKLKGTVESMMIILNKIKEQIGIMK